MIFPLKAALTALSAYPLYICGVFTFLYIETRESHKSMIKKYYLNVIVRHASDMQGDLR